MKQHETTYAMSCHPMAMPHEHRMARGRIWHPGCCGACWFLAQEVLTVFVEPDQKDYYRPAGPFIIVVIRGEDSRNSRFGRLSFSYVTPGASPCHMSPRVSLLLICRAGCLSFSGMGICVVSVWRKIKPSIRPVYI